MTNSTFLDNIINTVNLDYFGRSKISMSKSLLYFYLVLAAPLLSPLLSGQMQNYIKDNRALQHSLGFIALLTIIIDKGDITDITKALIYTTISYSWFILTTKLDVIWSIIIIILLFIGFLYDTNMKDREVKSEDDQALQEEDKDRIVKKHYNMKAVIFISILAVTLVGSYKYLTKQQIQHGGDFSYSKFVFNQ